MANFYYVKEDGSAAGDAGRVATTRLTGSFADRGSINYYATIALAFAATTVPVAGDFIFVSDAHSRTGDTAAQNWTGPATAGVVMIFSVSDTALDQYAAGASEVLASTADFVLTGHAYCRGVSITPDDDILMIAAPAGNWIFEDGTITLANANDLLRLSVDGGSVQLINCSVAFGNAAAGIRVEDGSKFEMFGGAFITTVVTSVFQGTAVGGGQQIICTGVDMSLQSGNIVADAGSDYTVDDAMLGEFRNCKMHASATFVEETLVSDNQRIIFIGCGATSAEAEFQFFVKALGGVAEDDLQYRDESTAFPSGEKTSIKIVTDANASIGAPFWFEMPSRFSKLSAASTDTIRLFFTSTTSGLTDTDVWAEVVYPDGTNKHDFTYLTNQNTDPLAAGTTHTDDSGSSAWKTSGDADLTGATEYRMDLDTSGDVGADGVPVVRIYVAVPSITVFFDTQFDLVA